MTKTARLYGNSLYELAKEEQLTDSILEQMEVIRGLFRENPEYVRLLLEPSIPQKERIALIEKAFGCQAYDENVQGTLFSERGKRYFVNFLKLLCERKLLNEYAGCCEEFTRRYDADHKIAGAVVTSAAALTPEQLSALQAKLEKISGKRILLTLKTDPSVIAGLRVELEGKQLEQTVQSRLAGISGKLNEIII